MSKFIDDWYQITDLSRTRQIIIALGHFKSSEASTCVHDGKSLLIYPRLEVLLLWNCSEPTFQKEFPTVWHLRRDKRQKSNLYYQVDFARRTDCFEIPSFPTNFE